MPLKSCMQAKTPVTLDCQPRQTREVAGLDSPFTGVSTRYVITCVYHFPVYSSTSSYLTKVKFRFIHSPL